MVEGHQCHRVAQAHRKVLVGKKFNASSPNGRFVDGAKAVHQQTLKKIEVHGKNLFYFFGEAEPVVVHIHFGMSGNFRISPQPGPAPTETTRLRMESEELGCVAHLSAMTVQHGGLELYEEKSSKLGPDPLRSDADKERLWAKMNATKKPIGLVLMDQSCVAGIGNIYRAEILFKAGLHPEQPANTVDRAAFERIWRHSVLLLQRGFVTGSILTVDPEEAKILGRPWTRRYIYNQASCGRCGSRIQTWDMANRTVYACSGCQKLQHAAKLPSQRKQAMAAAQDTRLFTSHCAPDDPEEVVPEKMTVAELKQQLKARSLPVSGNKPALLERLAAALASAKQEDAGGELNAEEPSQNDPAAVPASTAGVQPGTEHLPQMASARMAEKEKEAAGENRAVEHVALHFDLDMNSGSDAETDAKLAPSLDPVESRTAAGDGGRKKAAAGRKRPPARRENRSAASLTPQPRKRRAQRAEDGGDTSPKLDADDVSAAAPLPTKSESPRPRRSRRTARRGADVTASAQAAMLEPDMLKPNQGIRAMA